MFTTLIVQPIFNVLTFIYALIPGHNFGLAIILFTILIRFALLPLLKKQLRHTKAMRDMQPELKRIKEETKGDKQKATLLTMELYKEREIKPLSYLGLMVLQILLFLALFSGLNRVVNNPQEIYDFSYPVIQDLNFMQDLNADISKFDNTLFGEIDLSRAALDGETGFYFPAFLLVLGSALIQFFQIKQTMPSEKNARKLRDILKDANNGKESDSAEVNAAMGRNMAYFMPIIIFVVTIGFAAALSLYWFIGGLIAYVQQYRLLKQDEFMMESATATVVSKKPLKSSGVKVTTRTQGSSKPAKKPSSQKTKNTVAAKKRKKRKK